MSASTRCDASHGLLALPTELIHAILLALPPLCIEHFSQTCKLARQHVYGERRTGDDHLWKQLYLQRFDDYPILWDAVQDQGFQNALQENQQDNEDTARASSSSSSVAIARSSSSDSSTRKHAASSVMALVQLRERAARLYGGAPSDHKPITLNFNAVLSALLSVIDTAMPQVDTPSLNSTWLDDSILSSGQRTWSEWVFPRSIIHNLHEFKAESAQAGGPPSSNSQQERKRRRLTASKNDGRNEDETLSPTTTAAPGSSRGRSSSSKPTSGFLNEAKKGRPDPTRRRSARLLKLMYPESLHELVDEGIDVDLLAHPQVRLAARVHCLHGIRAWKDSQKQRLTASPQEIPGQAQRQLDGLANAGEAQAPDPSNLPSTSNQTEPSDPRQQTGYTVASAGEGNQRDAADRRPERGQDGPSSAGSQDREPTRTESLASTSRASPHQSAPEEHGVATQSTLRSTPNTEDTRDADAPAALHEGNDRGSDMEDDDDESFEEPPAARLRFRPRMFGPSFGFCSAPDEEDEVRARMRHRVYDSGHYGWSNGYGPLHAWRYDPEARLRPDGITDSEENDDDDSAEEESDNDVAMADARGSGSQDGDDDAFREGAELSDSDDVPDGPVPIEIEVDQDGGSRRRTFQVADRYGNPIDPASSLQAPRPADPSTRGWDSSDNEDEEPGHAPGDAGDTPVRGGPARTPYQAPELGTYDADTRTYTYEGHLPIGINTGRDSIQITVGNTIDLVASDELNVRFVRPGMLAETLRVTSGNVDGDDADGEPAALNVDEEDVEDDEDDDADDDYDEDADDWDDPGDEDDDNFGPFFDMFRPLAGAEGYRGCRADDEIKHLVEQRNAERGKDESTSQGPVSLRTKAIHWELVEAIMVVMYANLKEAIWLENWGVGIRIPKVFDHSGILVRDPMEVREFLDFPTGWTSSLAYPISSKINTQDATDEASVIKEVPASASLSGAIAPRVTKSVCETSQDPNAKPHDWARCESFWAGTYAFLDYSHFVDFNVRMARRRREALARAESAAQGNGNQAGKGKVNGNNAYLGNTPKPSLLGQEEAVGDCLQLRLELLPRSQQPAHNANEEGQEDDADYPTLYFRGTTVTYWGNEAPMPRGGVHGKVRPVYARDEDVDDILSKGPRGKKMIEGLHWSLTHVYEGEDRWQLEGIQPGPPGTRAPIFGIWTDAVHEEESPNGPFVYWMMDERPWQEIERLNRQEAHENAAARAARNR